MASPEKSATDETDSDPSAPLLRAAMNNNSAGSRPDLHVIGGAEAAAGLPSQSGSWAARVALQFALLAVHILVGAALLCWSTIQDQFSLHSLVEDWPPKLQFAFALFRALPPLSVAAHIFMIAKYLQRR